MDRIRDVAFTIDPARLLVLIDDADLTRMHNILGIIGAILSIYVMSLTSYENEDVMDPTWVQWVRRISYAVMSLAFVWTISYGKTKQWQPWAPDVLLMLGIIMSLLARAVGIHWRIHREGHRISTGRNY